MTRKRELTFSQLLCKFLAICDRLGFIVKIKETPYHTTAYLSNKITFRQYHQRKV